jgi:3-deoxy-D-manno-octulosonic acid kinase
MLIHQRMIKATIQTTTDGAILFDAGIAAQGGALERASIDPARFEQAWFEPAHWQAQGMSEQAHGGRGGVSYIDAPIGQCVLRHYRRGGMVARVMGDRYLWTGAERTRGFAEFRLLATLHDRGLHVPAPVAARYQRQGVHYRADLITRRIGHADTLAQLLAQQQCDAAVAARVGAALAQFHDAGAYHADLNAHNLLIDANAVWVIDFDRGELRAPARTWQLANLARLKRSLIKLGAARDGEAAFERALWTPLMAAYERELGHAPAARRSAA